MRQFTLLLATAAFVILSCGSFKPFSTFGQAMSLDGTPTGMVRLDLNEEALKALPESTTHFHFSVAGPEISPIEATIKRSQSYLQVMVPAGSERSVLVEALNAQEDSVGVFIQTGIQIQAGRCEVLDGSSGWVNPLEIQGGVL